MARINIIKMGSVPNFLLGLLLLVFSFCQAPVVVAQERQTYINQKHGFTLSYPAIYELNVAGDYLDFNKAGKTLFSLRVDDRFIEMLYQMLRPGLVAYRVGENPYRELARETRQNPELFRRYARQEAKGWCSADGPDGSVYCLAFKSETPFTSRSGLDCLELYPVMTRDDFASKTKQQQVVGPLLAVYLPKEGPPLFLMISPQPGESASPSLVQEMREIIDSLRMTPGVR